MATTSPLTGAPIPEPGDNIIDLLETPDSTLWLEKYANLRYATTALRDAAIPTPETGMVAVIGSGASQYLTRYDGSAWAAVEYIVTNTGSIMGTYSGQPKREWLRNVTLTTNAAGDATLMTVAQIAGGGVLHAQVSSTGGFPITGAFRNVSGELVVRLFNGASAAVSTNVAVTARIVYWTA